MSTEQPQEQPHQEQPPQEQPKEEQPQQEQPPQEEPKQEQPQQEQPPQEQPQQEQPPQEQPPQEQQAPQEEQQPPQEQEQQPPQEQEQHPPQEQPAKEEQKPPHQEQQPPQQENPPAETNNTEQQHQPPQQEQLPSETNNTEQLQPPQQEQLPSETNNTEQQEQKPPQQEQPVNMAEQQHNFAAAAAQAAQLAAKFGAESGKRKFDGEEGPDSKRQNTEGLQGTTTTGLDGQMTFTLMCAPDKVGRIIGKQGVTIRELEARTGVRVQVDHKAGTDLKPVHLIGSGTAVEQCKTLVHEVLTSETGSLSSGGETVRKVPCPPGIVGRIIGRGGETIRSLQSGSGAHIIVDQNFPPDQNREITISGRADCVDRATRMVNDLVSGDPASAQQVIQKYGVGTTRTIDCPKSVVGRVIGKGGETIKGLQKSHGTSVQIDQTVNPCKITVAGPTQAVMACQAAIEDVMEDRPAMGMGMGMGMGMPGGRPPFNPAMFGAPGPYGAAPYGTPYGAAPYGAAAPAYGGFPGAAAYPPAPAAANPYAAAMPQPNPYAPPAYSQPPAAYPGYGGAAPDPYAAAAAAQFGAAAPAAAAAAPAMPSVWQALQDDQGRTYYYNSQTGVSQWEKPAEMP